MYVKKKSTMHRSEISSAFILGFLLFNSGFGTPFKLVPTFRSVPKGINNGMNVKAKGSTYLLTETISEDNHSNTSVPFADLPNLPNYIPGLEQVIIDPREIFVRPPSPPYPLFYAAHADSVLSPEDHLHEHFQTENPYNAYEYYPTVQPFPAIDTYAIDDIRYGPVVQEVLPYKPIYNYTPLPYQLGTVLPSDTDANGIHVSSGSADINNELASPEIAVQNNEQISAALQDYTVQRILQIVKDFGKANTTSHDASSSRDDMFGPLKNLSIVTTTTVQQNNTTRVQSSIGVDESKSEIHSDGNRTISAEMIHVPVNRSQTTTWPTATTVEPERFIVEHFVDHNGNPCMKELVTTSQKKTYYVYTCEEKVVPQTTTTHSNVNLYKDELKILETTDENVAPEVELVESQSDLETTEMSVVRKDDLKDGLDTTTETKTEVPVATSSITTDQMLPQLLNDYAIFNLHE